MNRLQLVRHGGGLLRPEQHRHPVGHRLRALRGDHVEQLPLGGGKVAHHAGTGQKGEPSYSPRNNVQS